MFKKTLINFAMIQSVILMTSINVGFQIPTVSGHLAAAGFIWFTVFALSLLPTVIVSTVFAYLQRET